MKQVLPKFFPPHNPWLDSSVKYFEILETLTTLLVYIDNGGFAILVRNGQIRTLISNGVNRVTVLYYNGVTVNTKYTVTYKKEDGTVLKTTQFTPGENVIQKFDDVLYFWFI